jgi:Tol biopolymer transport system component/predicted Ser/Thr protein kinase
MPLAAGARLGPYEILAMLGAGGMGEVYRARDTRLGRDVAIKISADQFSERFDREARAIAALNHPNICQLYDVGPNYLVMEYVAGKTLEEVIGRKGLALSLVLRYAIQIADALVRAHAVNIVHRDLKPGNIMVTNDGAVKLLDFGLAKLTEPAATPTGATQTVTVAAAPRTEEGTILGTVAYMSPEQAEGKPVDTRSDIFSAGTVLYEMITGRRAFSGETRMSTLAAILNQEPKSASEISPAVPRDLERILTRCLRKDPARRFQHADDLKVALEEIKEESESGRIAAAESPALRRGKQSWAVLAAVGAILIAATGAITWWMLRDRAPQRGPTLVRLTADTGLTAYPALSADGKLLAYASDRASGGNAEGHLDIWVQQIGGGAPIRLTHDPADAREPSFSPDGTRIAFRSERGGGGIYVIPSLGGEERLIVEFGRTPRFSPDGNWIAYWTGDPGVFSQCKTFIIPAAGGQPRQIQAGMYSARFPAWAPDSRRLMITAASKGSNAGLPNFLDWWIAPIDGGPAVSVDAQPYLERYSVVPTSQDPGYWTGDSVVFAAGAGQPDSSNLWEISLSPRGTIKGAPRRLTASTTFEVHPAAIADSRQRTVAFTAGGGNPSIWSLPAAGNEGKVKGAMQLVVASAASSTLPSLTRDGGRMAFVSNRAGGLDIWIRDMAAGKESPLTSTPSVEESMPAISPDGSHVAYSVFEKTEIPTYVIPTGGGAAVRIGARGAVLQGWTPDSRKLIHRKALGGQSYLVTIDPGSGAETLLARHPQLGVTGPRFSRDGRWLALQTVVSPSKRQLFIAPLRDGAAADFKEWTAVTDGSGLDRNSASSPDGNLLYFLSERDGWRCFWAQKLDPASKRPVGAAFAVQHFHQARRSLLSFTEVADIGLVVAEDRILFSMPELTGNIWLARFE